MEKKPIECTFCGEPLTDLDIKEMGDTPVNMAICGACTWENLESPLNGSKFRTKKR